MTVLLVAHLNTRRMPAERVSARSGLMARSTLSASRKLRELLSSSFMSTEMATMSRSTWLAPMAM